MRGANQHDAIPSLEVLVNFSYPASLSTIANNYPLREILPFYICSSCPMRGDRNLIVLKMTPCRASTGTSSPSTTERQVPTVEIARRGSATNRRRPSLADHSIVKLFVPSDPEHRATTSSRDHVCVFSGGAVRQPPIAAPSGSRVAVCLGVFLSGAPLGEQPCHKIETTRALGHAGLLCRLPCDVADSGRLPGRRVARQTDWHHSSTGVAVKAERPFLVRQPAKSATLPRLSVAYLTAGGRRPPAPKHTYI